MKKLLLLLSCFILFSCGWSEIKCYEAVRQTYPNAIIYLIPGKDYSFIIRTATGIRYIETMNNTNTNITQDYLVFTLLNEGEIQ